MITLATCIVLLSFEPMPTHLLQKRMNTCTGLLNQARDHGVDPLIIGSIAYRESRFTTGRTSYAGAKGILQVIPKYWCPKRGKCNYTHAGFKAWRTYKKNRSIREALCRYGSGQACKFNAGGRRYAKLVLRTIKRTKKGIANIRSYIQLWQIYLTPLEYLNTSQP